MAKVEIGQIEAADGMNNTTYKFQILLDEGEKKVTVMAKGCTGTYVAKNNIHHILKNIDDEKGYALWGAPYNPRRGEEDLRRIEYRVHFDKDDVPTDLEIYAVTLDRRGNAKEPQSLKVKLPVFD